MNKRSLLLRGVVVAASCAWMVGTAAAASGQTTQSRPWVSGGVGNEERGTLQAGRDAFSLWVVTAAKKSGAFLADARVKILDQAGRPVLDAKLDGPWLFVELALGRYTVEASFRGEIQRSVTTIHSGDRHQVFFYFDVDAEVSPEQQSPARNPYGR